MTQTEILYLLLGVFVGMYLSTMIRWFVLRSFIWLMTISNDKSEKTQNARKSFKEILDEKLNEKGWTKE